MRHLVFRFKFSGLDVLKSSWGSVSPRAFSVRFFYRFGISIESKVMTPHSKTQPLWSESAALLSQAAAAFRGEGQRPAAKHLVMALLQAEKAAKQQRLVIPITALLGDWRLCFFTTGKATLRQQQGIGRGLYQPKWVPAQIEFENCTGTPESGSGNIHNQIQLGRLRLRLSGPMRYGDQRNLLAFDFDHMQLAVWGRPVYHGRFGKPHPEPFAQRSIAQLPFFTFFWATPEGVAARGRGGGLALWVRAALAASTQS